jgi:hypothetical protein
MTEPVDNLVPENVVSDIDILNPKVEGFPLSTGEVLNLHVLKFKQTSDILALLGKYYALFVSPTVETFMIVAFGEMREGFFIDIKTFLSMIARKPLEEVGPLIDELENHEVYLLLSKAIKLNISFFAAQLRQIPKKSTEGETIGELSSPV